MCMLLIFFINRKKPQTIGRTEGRYTKINLMSYYSLQLTDFFGV